MDIRAAAGVMRRLPLGLGPRGFLPNLYDLIVFVDRRRIRGDCPWRARDERVAQRARCRADHARPAQSARVCAAHHAAHVRGHSGIARLYVRGRDARRQKPQGRARHRPGARHPSISPGVGLSDVHGHILPRAVSGNELGAECAAIFAIFTAQAWNMTFSFYQSLRTVPSDLGRSVNTSSFRRGCGFGGWKSHSPPPA